MFISGYRGIGKSFLAAQADVPSNLAWFDMEEKGSGIHAQLNFGLYRPLTREVAQFLGADAGPGQLFPAITQAFTSLEQDRFTVAVIDNIKPLEDAALWAVKENPQRYGVDPRNARSGRFGGAWPGVHYIVSNLCDILQSRGVRLVVVTSHIKRRWGGAGPIPGKFSVKGVDRWQELSILTLILIRGEHMPIPAALVQKEQLGLIQYNEEKRDFIVQRRLPFRVPKCTFSEIRRYLREPADLRSPEEGEVPTEAETAPFDEKLSREQLALLMAGMREESEMEEAVTKGEPSMPASAPTTWQELLEVTGKSMEDLGGIVKARGMGEEEIRRRWEEWK